MNPWDCPIQLFSDGRYVVLNLGSILFQWKTFSCELFFHGISLQDDLYYMHLPRPANGVVNSWNPPCTAHSESASPVPNICLMHFKCQMTRICHRRHLTCAGDLLIQKTAATDSSASPQIFSTPFITDSPHTLCAPFLLFTSWITMGWSYGGKERPVGKVHEWRKEARLLCHFLMCYNKRKYRKRKDSVDLVL